MYMREWLRQMRKGSGLTQEQLSKTTGNSQQYINMIENGRRQADMSYSMMENLAVAFGVPVQDIVDAEKAYTAARATGSVNVQGGMKS